MPPLRERSEDIPLLARHFVRQAAARMGKELRELPPEVLDRLMDHHWPGNIRELENVLERAVILSRGGMVEIPDFGPDLSPPSHADAASKAPPGRL